MRALDILNEQHDAYVIVDRRPLREEEKDLLRDFQRVLTLIADFYIKPDRHKFTQLRSDLQPYHNRGFMVAVRKWLDKVANHHDSIDRNAKAWPSVLPKLSSAASLGKAAFLSGDRKAILRAGMVCASIVDVRTKAIQKENEYYDNRKFGPLYIQNPMFFGTKNFLKIFEEDEIEQVCGVDPDRAFTYVDAPDSDNFQYLAHWALELTETDEPIAMKPSTFNRWVELQYRDDPNFQRLLKKVDDYLHRNNKSLVPEIISGLRQFPVLAETHERIIQSITTVYRGVPLTDEGESTARGIVRRELEQKYVATSKWKPAAKNFALSRGHMESAGRTDGVVLEYAVTPEAIVLDTSIFGSIFGESEVLIDPRKAKLIDYDVFYID